MERVSKRVANCELEEFYQLLTRAQGALSKGIAAIRRFDKSKQGKGVMRDAATRVRALAMINDRMAVRRHEVGRQLDKKNAAVLMPWQTSTLGHYDSPPA